MTKSLLVGYVGVKYTPDQAGDALPAEYAPLHAVFRRCGERLREHDMTPANGGNMSQRVADGLVMTTSGCNLGHIDADELALVQACSLEAQQVTYVGAAPPTSEAMLHWIIAARFTEASAILHAHDPVGTSSGAATGLPETAREEPYGTVALARLAAETFEN